MDNTNLNNEAIHQPGLITKLKAATEKVNKLGGRVAIEQLPHHADVQEFKRLVKMKRKNLSKWEKQVDESVKEPYEDSVKRAIRAAHKKKDAEAAVYYIGCLTNNSACASFERFKGSAAYESWKGRRDVSGKIAAQNAEYKRFSYMNETDSQTSNKNNCPRCKGTGKLIGKGQFVKNIRINCPKCGDGKVIKEEFDVESDEHWEDEKMIGLMKQKDVGQGHGTLRFKSNSGTTYTVELSKGKILSLKDHRGNEYELPEIQKYWEEGFPLIGAIAATIGDDGSSQPDEEEKQMLYSPEELQETQSSETVGGRYGIKVNSVNPSLGNKRSTWLYKNEAGVIVRFNSEREAEEVIEKLKKDTSIADRTMKSYQIAPLKGESELPRKRCERCGKPVNPGISSTKCPSCHESSLEDAERHYGVQETVTDDEVGMGCNVGDTTTQISPVALSEEAPPGFPKSIYEKLVIKFKGDKRKINEVMWELHNKSKRTVHSLDEKDPPGFPKSIRDKLLTRYKSEPEKAYAIMWKLHNEHGDKLESVVNEAKKKIVKKKTKTDSRQSQGIDCMVAGGPN